MAATNDSRVSQPPVKAASNKSKIQVIDMKQEEHLAANMSNLTVVNPNDINITTDEYHTEKEPSRTRLTTLKSSTGTNGNVQK